MLFQENIQAFSWKKYQPVDKVCYFKIENPGPSEAWLVLKIAWKVGWEVFYILKEDTSIISDVNDTR